MAVVSMAFVSFFSSSQLFLEFFVYLAQVGSQVCDSRYQETCGFIWKKTRMNIIVSKEKASLGGGMGCMSVGKFRPIYVKFTLLELHIQVPLVESLRHCVHVHQST